MPAQRDRTAIITGANSGIGFETASALASHGANVVLAVRDVEKGKSAAAAIEQRCPHARVTVTRVDLTSLRSVRDGAAELRSLHPRIDLLINNAGVMLTPKSTTADGFELQFGTNHLGHFALTALLLEQLSTTAGSRIVTISSLGHRVRSDIDFTDLHGERSYDRMTAYGRSKLANLLFCYELQRRLVAAGKTNTLSVAAHPGNSRTDLARNSPRWIRYTFRVAGPVVCQSAAMGALPSLRAACDPSVVGGEYYGPRGYGEQRGYPKKVASSDQSHDLELARRLWELSEELTGVTYPL